MKQNNQVITLNKSVTFLTLLIAAITISAMMIQAATIQVTENSPQSAKEKEKQKKAKADDDDDDKAKKEAEAKKFKNDLKASSKTSSKVSKPVSPSDKSRPMVAPAVPHPADKFDTVAATVETEPVKRGGDAADDPAIWIHPTNPELSTIIATDKQGGLVVYDLAGKELQYVAEGKPDNVDLRDGFKLGNQTVSLVTAGNRADNTIQIYRVNAQTRMLENVAARKIPTLQVYGSCMYRSAKTGKFYYFANSKTGAVEQWELFDNGSGKVDGRKVRSFKVGSVTEGCVADDETGDFYLSEEAVGIWKFGAEPEAGDTRTQIDKTGPGGHLSADVEGLTIVYGRDGKGWLIASSQGTYSYVVYRREGKNEYVRTFKIGEGNGVDAVEETDGIDATAANLGPAFPHGVFIAQDGFNDKGNQNFKLVPLHLILDKQE
jgi:3-phytase